MSMLKRSILTILFSCLFHASYGNEPREALTLQADQEIEILYHNLKKNPTTSISERLLWFSAQFLDRPYFLGPLGEGSKGRYDQMPLYRTDAFDCQTFVETIMALAFSDGLESFKQCLQDIRYKNNEIDFTTRHHFTSIDWNPSNEAHGYLKDITKSLAQNQSPAIAEAIIDKASWYQHLTENNIRLNPPNYELQHQRLLELQKKTSSIKSETSRVLYLPFDLLFLADGTPNKALLDKMPASSLIEIVRPNWDLSKELGTHLNISHMGFVFRVHHELIFRQASSLTKKITDMPLVTYLESLRKSPTIRGINVFAFPENFPLKKACG